MSEELTELKNMQFDSESHWQAQHRRERLERLLLATTAGYFEGRRRDSGALPPKVEKFY